jgi:hypothetical protein
MHKATKKNTLDRNISITKKDLHFSIPAISEGDFSG